MKNKNNLTTKAMSSEPAIPVKLKKNEFNVITKKEYNFIPWYAVIIRDSEGWVYIAKKDTQWFVNSTQDNKDGLEDEEKFLKKLVKRIKENLLNT